MNPEEQPQPVALRARVQTQAVAEILRITGDSDIISLPN